MDSLNVSARCGLSSNAFQIRPMLERDQPGPFGHLRPRPVRGVRRCGLQGRHHDVLDLLAGDRRWTAGPRVIGQPVQAALDEPGPPLADHLGRDPELLGDRGVRPTLGAGQHDPRPHRQRLRRGAPPRPPLQLLALINGQFQRSLRTSGAGHAPYYDLTCEILAHDTRTALNNPGVGPG